MNMRYDMSDPKDAATMMANGIIWQGGPQTMQTAVNMLVDGEVAATRQIIANIPPDILALIDRKRADLGSAPLAEALRTTEDDGA